MISKLTAYVQDHASVEDFYRYSARAAIHEDSHVPTAEAERLAFAEVFPGQEVPL